MKKQILQVASLKPRNVFARLAACRRAGAHQAPKRREEDKKDLVQRLREAGM